MKRTKSTYLALVVLLSPMAANADLIIGDIIVSGGAANTTGTDSNGDGTISLGEATGVDFTLAGLVFGTSGDFAAVPFFTPVTFNDFIFNPSLSIDPLWTLGVGGLTFSFAADNFSVISQSDVFLNIVGSGTISGTGYDDTAGAWSFTMTSQGSQFGWSSGTRAEATVPEPGTLALFGIGLAAMGLARRRKKT